MAKINSCGKCRKCCQESIIRVFKEDLNRWKKEQRYDILLCCETWTGTTAFLISKKDDSGCIFLDMKKGCEIYDTRPKICKEYPKSQKHADKFNCILDWETKKPKNT